MNRLQELERKIQYKFHDIELLKTALRHSSYVNEHRMNRLDCNERTEFLGDAVLELVSSEHLFKTYPKMPEGELTRLRASLVCEPTLAFCARELGLGEFLSLGKGEEMTGGRHRDSVTSDAMEAVIGAIYLDGGFANAKEFIDRFILDDIENKQLFYDSKTTLQEIVQGSYDEDVRYEIVKEEGPDHNKNFYVHALLGERILGEGCGHTKKAAEQQAAYCAIKKLRKQG